jgi:micrococcal nuclease
VRAPTSFGRTRFVPTRVARIAFASALALAAAVAALAGTASERGRDVAAAAPASETRVVARASDGDTLVLAGGERVRLIGVDTPEKDHANPRVRDFAEAATRFTRERAVGREVRLDFESGSRRDRYGRTLAYVYLPDGELLNLAIVREGYGFAYTRFPFALQKEFKRAEGEARRARRGLWADLGDDARRNARQRAR